MKVLSIEQIRQADAYTIKNEPVASIDLMERAAHGCYRWIKEHVAGEQPVILFCGMGNNGGDGLVIARKLADEGTSVTVYLVEHSSKPSEDNRINLQRLEQQGLTSIITINEESLNIQLPAHSLVIDAMLGSGITKPVTGLLRTVIGRVNDSAAKVVSIDIPSGLICGQANDNSKNTVIHASYTLTFEVPRLDYFWPENEQFVGEWFIIPIGLHKDFLEQVTTKHYMSGKSDIAGLLHPRTKFAHKGNFGHGLLISGSYGKMGAAVLGAKAALRTGSGLVTVHLPAKGYSIMQTAVPEAMCSIDTAEEIFSAPPDLSSYNAIAVGPGIGTTAYTATALKLLIQNSPIPLVIDADALNILGENKTWLSFLPRHSILTPHFKEFERLAGKVSDSFERNRKQMELSIKYGVFIVLKGAYTCISFPDGRCFFNPTGNPGMATGGSGDVLTGIILGFLAQHYPPGEAVLLGTYFHGLAGDLAAANIGQESLIAGDIIDYIPAAFTHFC